ncbi:MAG: hypothetical protein ACR2HZ_10310 [Gemmatimonadaceae bacterium]
MAEPEPQDPAAQREPVRLATHANAVAITRASLGFIVVAILYISRELYVGAFLSPSSPSGWRASMDGSRGDSPRCRGSGQRSTS